MRRLLYLFVVVVATACSYSGAYPGHGFDEAEALLHSDPAAALEKLNAYDLIRFDDSAVMARWALLYSEALVVNNLAAPTDTIADIAVNYYRAHGNADEFHRASRLKALIKSGDHRDRLATALYLQKEKEFMLYKERAERQWYVAGFALIVGFAFIIILWQRQRLKIRILENTALINEASGLREECENLSSRLGATFLNRFGVIDELCQTYYESQGAGTEKKAIVAKVRSQIDALKTDEGLFAEMERAVNACRSDLLVLFKDEMPAVKRDDYSLMVYIASGLSSRTIALLVGESIDVVYKRKSRLKAKISVADAPHCALFLSVF